MQRQVEVQQAIRRHSYYRAGSIGDKGVERIGISLAGAAIEQRQAELLQRMVSPLWVLPLGLILFYCHGCLR